MHAVWRRSGMLVALQGFLVMPRACLHLARPSAWPQADFKSTVVRSQGFEYKPQRPGATRLDSQKWAWIGAAPGSFVVLRLNTLLTLGDGGSSGNSTAPARLYLGHVCSWQPLGSATVECVSGCVCNATKMYHQ